MTGTKIVDLDPIISISPEDVFLVENVSETLSNSVTYANLVSFISNSISVSGTTEWQNNGTSVVTSGFVNFTGGVSVADVGGVATIDISSGSSLAIFDDGVEVAAAATGLNFVGANTSTSANTTTIAINKTITVDSSNPVVTTNFIATSEQTDLVVDYYTTNVDVFVNGVKLRQNQYTATSGTTIVLDTGLDTGTWASVETSKDTYNASDYIATANQTSFAFTYLPININIFVSGIKLQNNQYTALNGTSITLNTPLELGTWVCVESGAKDYLNFTATAEQTDIPINYTPHNVSVYVSGIKLRTDDYAAINGTTIIINNILSTDTWVHVRSPDA